MFTFNKNIKFNFPEQKENKILKIWSDGELIYHKDANIELKNKLDSELKEKIKDNKPKLKI